MSNMWVALCALYQSPLIITVTVLLVSVGAVRLAASFIHRGE